MSKSPVVIRMKIIDRYTMVRQLSRGDHATVILAEANDTGQKFVIKSIAKDEMRKNAAREKLFKTELSILRKVQHDNIIRLFEVLESSSNFHLVIEYCNQGDFDKFRNSKKLGRIPERQAVEFLGQVKEAFRELRKHQVIHRDLKLSNILVHDGRIKLGDFGSAAKGYEVVRSFVGTFMTMAPELIESMGEIDYDSKCDLWSIGVVYYQMLFNELPYFGFTPNEIYARISQMEKAMVFPTQVSPASEDLLKRLLRKDPKVRMSWDDFFNHELFSLNAKFSFGQMPNPGLETPPSIEAIDMSQTRKNTPAWLDKHRNATPSVASTRAFDSAKSFLSRNSSVSSRRRGQSFSEENSISFAWPKPAAAELPPGHRHDPSRDFVRIGLKRLDHEKKKHMFILLTVREARRLSKIWASETLGEGLRGVCVVLTKKALVMTNFIIYSLEKKVNIFELRNFDAFLELSEIKKYLEELKKDVSTIKSYFDHLTREDPLRMSSIGSSHLIMRAEGCEDLIELDQMIGPLFERIRVEIPKTSGKNRQDLVIVLLAVFYSVRSEKMMAFDPLKELLSFEEFLKRRQHLDVVELLNEIKSLT